MAPRSTPTKRRARRVSASARRDDDLLRLRDVVRTLADARDDPLQELALLVARRWADACVIHLEEPGGALAAVAVACPDPELLGELLGAIHGLAVAVVRGGEPRSVAGDALQRIALDEEARALAAGLAARACLCAPIRAGGRTRGALTLVHTHRDLRPRDAHLAELLALEIALVVDRVHPASPPEAVLDIAAHDVRNALGSLVLASESMERVLAPDRPPAARDALALIKRSAAHIEQVMSDALEAEHLARSGARVSPAALEPRELVAAAIAAALPHLGDLEIDARLPDTLPRIAADPEHARRILLGLLASAARSARDGRILVAAEPCPGGVLFRVGPGEDAARRDGRRPPAGPTRLALTIASLLAEAHRGRLWSETRSDARIVHCLVLPAA